MLGFDFISILKCLYCSCAQCFQICAKLTRWDILWIISTKLGIDCWTKCQLWWFLFILLVEYIISNYHCRSSWKWRWDIWNSPRYSTCFRDYLNTKFITNRPKSFTIFNGIEKYHLRWYWELLNADLFNSSVERSLLLWSWKDK